MKNIKHLMTHYKAQMSTINITIVNWKLSIGNSEEVKP